MTEINESAMCFALMTVMIDKEGDIKGIKNQLIASDLVIYGWR